jgi:hypothetical protein
MVVAMSEESCSLEKTFNTAYDAVTDSCRESYRKCELKIHQSPGSAVLIAAAVGYGASVLPTGRIMGAVARLAFSLAKPALIVIGALKILECLDKKARQARQVERLEKDREPLIDSPTGPPQG